MYYSCSYSVFRCICVVAKRACWLHHVCPHVFLWLPLDGFLWNFILGIVWKSVDRLQILWEVYILGTLHKDLSMFYCCWWQKFARRPFLCDIQYFYAADSAVQLSNTPEWIVAFSLYWWLCECLRVLCYVIFSAVCLNVMPIYFIVYFNFIHQLIVSRDSQDRWVGFCYFVSLYICVRHIVNGCPEWSTESL